MTSAIVLVLRSSGDFDTSHVLRLWSQLRDRGGWEGRVVCLTDQMSGWAPAEIELRPLLRDWDGWWSKLELCAPEHMDLEAVLYIDLDTTVYGRLDDIVARRHLTLLSDFYVPQLLASGVMYLPAKERRRAWELLYAGAGPDVVMRSFRRKGDQAFFRLAWHGVADRWQDVLPGQLVSYKEHVRPSGNVVPWDARIICHHGYPRPWEVMCD